MVRPFTRWVVLCFCAGLLAACSPRGMIGQVLTESPSPDGTVLATLTREGDTYRLYLSLKSGADDPVEMLRTEQRSNPELVWKSDTLVSLHHACGRLIEYPRGTGNGYSHPGGLDIEAGFSNVDCR
jgi:hypothetical protein